MPTQLAVGGTDAVPGYPNEGGGGVGVGVVLSVADDLLFETCACVYKHRLQLLSRVVIFKGCLDVDDTAKSHSHL